MSESYLSRIESPADLKKLPVEKLPILAEEVRRHIIENIQKTGGHLAPSLGVVELTIALLYVFEPPVDHVLWDVGHQAYPWKVLTGRRDALKHIRQYGGISGFQKRSESEYDAFGAGHASTSISAALGFSVGNYLLNEAARVIAIIGDGALTGGLAYEGLNNTGHLRKQMMVILNDNEMSISPNVGAMSHYLHKIVTNPIYNRLRDQIWELTSVLPGKPLIRRGLKKIEESLKVLLVPGIIFDELGFRYFGPIDGHNIPLLIDTFNKLKNIKTPVLLHILTRKGKGLPAAENDPTSYHGIKGKVGTEPETEAPSYTKVFGRLITEIGHQNEKVITVTAAMCDGTGLNQFRDTFPKRYFDVGIAEGHAVTFAAGLAAKGFRPVVSIYSTFMQRAIDSLIHDISLQHLPVIFAIDRGGLVGEDGPTHHGVFDLTYLSMIPDVIVSAPKDGNELRDLLHTALTVIDKPFFIRYPRDHAVRFDPDGKAKILPIGSWEILQQGKKLAVIATGAMVWEAEHAIQLLKTDGISPTLVNARFIKPLDTKLLEKLADEHKTLLIIEENVPTGGLASAVMQHLQQNEVKVKIATMSLPDGYTTHGARSQILEDAGLSNQAIVKKILKILKKE
jgi:1-deoxy-D-xylulose-5-phosphate synthase